MNPKVDAFLRKADKWFREMEQLRMIILDCELMEELKQGSPCYTYKKQNLIIIGNFKNYCTISFIKGVLLNDAEEILQKPGENSQSARIIRFTAVEEIIALKPTLKAYIFEAIEAEKAGLKVDFKTNTVDDIPEELHSILNEDAVLKEAYFALTPGRQRAYLLFFNGAKQSKTRTTRIHKYIPRIMAGKGINDCICGLSRRMPNCDGSHKSIGRTV